MLGSKPSALPLGDAPIQNLLKLITLESVQQRGTVDTPRNKTFEIRRSRLPGIQGLLLLGKGGEDTGAGSGETGLGKLVQPVQCGGNLGVAPANHGETVIAAVAPEKVAYFDPG